MITPILSLHHVGKKYQIGTASSYLSLRDSLTSLIKPRTKQKKTEFWALKDVHFDLQRGQTLGLIGRNGAGKSTLLKILSHITPPTTGTITLRGRVASLLEVGTGFHPELTGRENIFLNGAVLGMSRAEIARKFDEIVTFADITAFLDTPVKRYSSGMYVRLAFAVAAHLDPEILVIDEVLAVGDAEFQKKCLGKMREVGQSGRTVIFVSHNMSAIKQLCSHGLLLTNGKTKGVQPIETVIRSYLSEAKQLERTFTNAPVTYAYVRQEGTSLLCGIRYSHNKPLRVPCFGFVISDIYGNPICGSNPVINPPATPIPSRASGTVDARITSPRLLDGTYNVSIWFGDDKETFFSAQDCLTFDVIHMAPHKQLPVSAVGPVFPECEWSFGE